MKIVTQDLLRAIPDKDYLIAHGCNAKGIMGAGFARQLKERFPEAYQAYRYLCRFGLHPGDVHMYRRSDRVIANMITQPKPGPHATLEAIEECLGHIDEPDLFCCAPMVGCGLGGLDWADVAPLFEAHPNEWTIYTLEEQ